MMMTPPAIRWNTLVDQKTGAIGQFRDCFSEVTSNLVVQHTGDGIVIGHSAPRIGGNNLLSTSDGYAVKFDWSAKPQAPDVDATENYWGSGYPVEIEVKICDRVDT